MKPHGMNATRSSANQSHEKKKLVCHIPDSVDLRVYVLVLFFSTLFNSLVETGIFPLTSYIYILAHIICKTVAAALRLLSLFNTKSLRVEISSKSANEEMTQMMSFKSES